MPDGRHTASSAGAAPGEPGALAAFRASFSPRDRLLRRMGGAAGFVLGLAADFLRSPAGAARAAVSARRAARSGIFDADYLCWAHPGVSARRFASPLLDHARGGWREGRVADRFLDAVCGAAGEPPAADPLVAHAGRFGAGRRPTAASALALDAGLHPLRAASEERAASLRRARAETAAKPPLAVVVPVYDHPELLPPLVASLLEHTPPDVLLLFVENGSRDARVRPALLRLEAAWPGRVRVECLDENAGFAGACNRGIRAAGRRDVILLNNDTVVSPRWSDVLRLAAYGGPKVGSATAVSNNSGAVSLPERGFNAMPPGATVAQAARTWLHGPDVAFDWHTGHGFCMYLRRDMLDETGLFDEETFGKGYGEENDLCLRAWRKGWSHRIVPRAFVWHLNAASFGSAEKSERVRKAGEILRGRYPELDALEASRFRGWEAARGRFRLVAAAAAQSGPAKPRVLFVLGGITGGGTFETTLDLAAAVRREVEPFALVLNGREMRLLDLSGASPRVAARHVLADFVPFGTHELAEFDDALVDWVLGLGVELVHVRHLLRASAGFLPRLRALHVPVVFSFHDYYAASPALKLLDSEFRFRPEGVGDGKTRFADWTPGAAGGPVLDAGFARRWKERFEERVAPFCDAFVTTSRDAKARLQSLLPVLRGRDADFGVIPHGRDFASFGQFAAPLPGAGAPVAILVPGAFCPEKGSALVEAMAEEDRGRTVVFHVLGAPPDPAAARDRPGLVFHGAYRRSDFAARVREIAPSMAAVLSPWPETWCHTLTECWAAGLPVFAFDLGAPAERLRGECPGGGWLLAPEATAGEVLASIRAAAADGPDFERRVEAVREWQNGAGALGTAHVMASRYLDVYFRLLDHSRAGAAPDAPAPFAGEKTGDATPRDPAALDREDVSAARTLRLRGFPLRRADDARAVLLARLCGAKLSLDLRSDDDALWRDSAATHRALLAAADEVLKPNRPPLGPDRMPVPRVARFVPPAPWLQEKRNAAWAAAAAARAGKPAPTVVFTAIAGAYDSLKIPEDPDPDADYVCFCDTPPPGPRGPWELRPFAWSHPSDPTRTARWHKTHGCELFPDRETAIWCDANLVLRGGVVREIREKLLAGGNPIATLRHFDRDNIQAEAETCVFYGNDDPFLLRSQIARYIAAGLPGKQPFAETSIVAARPSDPRARAVFATWWEEIASGSRRDQISFPFAMWKNGADFTPLFDRDIRLETDKVRFETHEATGQVPPAPHSRQFVLSRRPFDRPGFRHLDLPDGFVLSFHPDLCVRATPDRRNVLLGLAWSCDPAVADPLAAAAACETDDALERVLDDWSGRWILLRDGKLRMDACGLLGVFFRGSDCSSSLALLDVFLGLRHRRPGLRHQFGGMDFYPGPLTPQPGVRRLLPGQGLDLASGAAFERPPEPEPPAFASEDERIAGVVSAFDVLLRRIAADYPGRVRLPLTAGYDSRTLAALLEHSGVEYETFTMDHSLIRIGDRDIPPLLAARVGRRHRFVPRPDHPDSARYRIYDEHCAGLAVDEDRNFFAFGQYPQSANRRRRVAVLRGGVWESVREYYREKHHLLRTAQDIREFTSAFMIVRYRTDLQRAYTVWLEHCRAVPSAFDPVDRYYLEQRAGAWLSSVEQSLDVIPGMDSIQPCNCRRILSLLRSFPREERIEAAHQVAIVRSACPALLDEPFQSDRTYAHGNPERQQSGTVRTYLRCLGVRGTLRLIFDKIRRK